MLKNTLKILGLGSALSLAAGPALAEVSPETAYVFNTFLFLVCGFLVMFMAAGFAMLESGMVRSKNVATICLKNISLFSFLLYSQKLSLSVNFLIHLIDNSAFIILSSINSIFNLSGNLFLNPSSDIFITLNPIKIKNKKEMLNFFFELEKVFRKKFGFWIK